MTETEEGYGTLHHRVILFFLPMRWNEVWFGHRHCRLQLLTESERWTRDQMDTVLRRVCRRAGLRRSLDSVNVEEEDVLYVSLINPNSIDLTSLGSREEGAVHSHKLLFSIMSIESASAVIL